MLNPLSQVLVVTLLSASHSTEIVQHVLSEETSRTLSCSSPSPWFFCVWESPNSDRLCSVRGQGGDIRQEACGYPDSRLELAPNTTHCQLVIRDLDITDQGNWTCALTDDNMETVKQVTTINIIKYGNISLEKEDSGETDIVEILEGERLELNCRLEQVWPAASLQWSLEKDGKPLLEVEREELELEVGEEVVVSECSQCPVTVQQRLSARLHSGHSGLEVRCEDGQRAMASLQVTVTVPSKADLELLRQHQGLGLMPGILISSILVLLSLAILVSFCIRGSRNRKQKQNHTEGEDPELGKGFVENENMVKGGEGGSDVIENVYDDSNKDTSFTDSSIHSSDNSDSNISESLTPSDDDKDRPQRA